MQSPQRTLSIVLTSFVLVATAVLVAPLPANAQASPMQFGTSVGGVADQAKQGIKPEYGGLWAGPWTIDNWGYFDGQLATLSSQGVTPVIQFYYWGNDLNTDCWYNGCWSGVHGYWKSQEGWTKLATQLTQHLNSKLAGKKAIIVLETEFNKGNMGYSETLDAGLASKAWFLRNHYSGAVVALGFGNWGHSGWGVFDRAAAASNEMGLQGMRGSTRDSVSSYLGLPASLVRGAQELKARFNKPIIIHDIAASSYPEPDWLKHQASVVQGLFGKMGEFKAAGVHALVYRSNTDSPTATTAEYYGQAERHFGLRWYSNGTAKPSFNAWRNGILAERGGASPAPAPPPPATTGSSSFTPTFTIKAPNNWWQEVFLSGTSHGITRTDVRIEGGAWQPMKKSSWGAWTSSYNAKNGARVEFLATSTQGPTAKSAPFTWMDGTSSRPTEGAPSTSPAPAPTSSSSSTTNSGSIQAPTSGSAYKEIEAFATRSTGSTLYTGAASGGKAWALWSNGYASETASFPPGIYEIRVRAQGETAQAARAHMDVHVGTLRVLGADVYSGNWYDYVGKISFSQSTTQTLKVSFTNDLRTSTEDRNLWLDRVEIRRVG